MKLAVLKETRDGETRVAAVPETVKKFIALGFNVAVEQGAGAMAAFSDESYADAGASVEPTAEATAKNADVILKVQRPDAAELAQYGTGAKLVGILSPYTDQESLNAYAKAGVDAFAMEFMPRITRAQSMDVLSSQSNLAGYKAVIDAAAEYGRAMPMMMTAAGTIAPAKVFVMGAGVAGLQAIATAKRLGAVVSATDVRYAAKEQVESLGGTFVVVDEDAMGKAFGWHDQSSVFAMAPGSLSGYPASVTLTASSNPSFLPRGTASNLASITLTNSAGSKKITVSITGRVKVKS